MALLGHRKTSGAPGTTSKKKSAASNGTSQSMSRLFRALQDADETVRSAAATALGEKSDRNVVPSLIHCLSDHSPVVRQSAAQSLGWLQDSTAIPYLLASLHDPEPDVMMTAALAIQWIGNPSAIPGLLEVVRTTPNLAVQQVVHSILTELSGRVIDEAPLHDRSNGRRAAVTLAPGPIHPRPIDSGNHTGSNSPAPATNHVPKSLLDHTSVRVSPEELWIQTASEPTRRHEVVRHAVPARKPARTASRWRQVSGVLGMMGGLIAIIGGLGIGMWGSNWISSGPVLGISIALVGVGLALAGYGQINRSSLLGAGIIIAGAGGTIIGGVYTITGWIYLGSRPGLSGWGLAAIGIWLLLVGIGAIVYGIRRSGAQSANARRSR